MTSLLRRCFVEDAALKALALVLTLSLFVFVRYDRNAIAAVYVKVVFVPPRGQVLTSEPVPEVRVTVRGSITRLSRLDEHALPPIRVSLEPADFVDGSGELRFEEDMVQLPPGLHVSAISPASMRVTLEPLLEREVPVEPVLEGAPAAGFRVTRTTAVPAQVKVAGARSAVERIVAAPTSVLRITDASGNVHGRASLVAAPVHATWVGVPSGEGSVRVEVEIAPAFGEQLVRDVPVRALGASRLEAEVYPGRVDVALRGPAELLARVGPGLLGVVVDAQAEDARPPGAHQHKPLRVVGLPAGVAAELRPAEATLVTRRRRE